MLLTSVCYLLATITLGNHDHATAIILEQVHVRVHTTGSCRAERTGSHSGRSLGRTCIINRMIFDVLRQTFTLVDTLFQFGMSNVTTYNDRSAQRKTS